MKKPLVLILLTIGFFVQLKGQTQVENHKKYWEARDRFRKYFTKIGNEQGESIPLDTRRHVGSILPIHAGDATSYLGQYIAVLAAEYKLLKNDTQKPQILYSF